MTHKTLEAVLHPDGRVTLSPAEPPDHPVRVLVTFLEPEEEAALSEPGDYLEQLTDYEGRLARGEIRCTGSANPIHQFLCSGFIFGGA